MNTAPPTTELGRALARVNVHMRRRWYKQPEFRYYEEQVARERGHALTSAREHVAVPECEKL